MAHAYLNKMKHVEHTGNRPHQIDKQKLITRTINNKHGLAFLIRNEGIEYEAGVKIEGLGESKFITVKQGETKHVGPFPVDKWGKEITFTYKAEIEDK